MNVSLPKETLLFLKQLEKNNNREWFNNHKEEFKAIEAKVKAFNNQVFNNLNLHDDIDKLKHFRIYRDVRFSKNKQPYKTNFGSAFHRTKPALRGGYYIHLEPNNQSFLAVGFWKPNKEDLYRIRKEFEIDDTEIQDIISNKKLKSIWGNLTGDEVKTAPKGFNKEHPAINLIKKKQYFFTKSLTDKEVLDSGFINQIDDAFKAIRPYFDYMSDILTTNLNGESLL